MANPSPSKSFSATEAATQLEKSLNLTPKRIVAPATVALAAAVLGIEVVRDYYLEVGPQVAALYRGHDTNYSLTTLGTRLFEGFGNNFRVAPLYASPALARLATLLSFLPLMLVGSPDTISRQIELALSRIPIRECFLLIPQGIHDRGQILKSLELFATVVAPRFSNH